MKKHFLLSIALLLFIQTSNVNAMRRITINQESPNQEPFNTKINNILSRLEALNDDRLSEKEKKDLYKEMTELLNKYERKASSDTCEEFTAVILFISAVVGGFWYFSGN